MIELLLVGVLDYGVGVPEIPGQLSFGPAPGYVFQCDVITPRGKHLALNGSFPPAQYLVNGRGLPVLLNSRDGSKKLTQLLPKITFSRDEFFKYPSNLGSAVTSGQIQEESAIIAAVPDRIEETGYGVTPLEETLNRNRQNYTLYFQFPYDDPVGSVRITRTMGTRSEFNVGLGYCKTSMSVGAGVHVPRGASYFVEEEPDSERVRERYK